MNINYLCYSAFVRYFLIENIFYYFEQNEYRTNYILITVLDRVAFFSPNYFLSMLMNCHERCLLTRLGVILIKKIDNRVIYAADLCILSASPSSLQKLMNICFKYSSRIF